MRTALLYPLPVPTTQSYASTDPTVQALIQQLSAAIQNQDWATVLSTAMQLTALGVGQWTGGAPGMGDFVVEDTVIDGQTGQASGGSTDENGNFVIGPAGISPWMILAGAGLFWLAYQ